MSNVYFEKPIRSQYGNAANLKIVNDDGEMLSIAGDDSCGAMPKLGRVTMLRYNQEYRALSAEMFAPTAVDILVELATHLGYRIEPKSTPRPVHTSEDVKAIVLECVNGDKSRWIQAIKMMREMFPGMSLKTAKNVVSDMIDDEQQQRKWERQQREWERQRRELMGE